MIIKPQKVEIKWSNSNKKRYEKLGYEFTKNEDVFLIDIDELPKTSKFKVQCLCDFCKKAFIRSFQLVNRNAHQFCSHKCSVKYQSKISNENNPKRSCEYCNEIYSYPRHLDGITRFCSASCMSKWQSENFKGENSSVYVERFTVKCSWCGKELQRTKNQIDTRENHFCSNECRQIYHKEIYMKREDVKEMLRNNTLKVLNENRISFTNSKPQQIVNSILDQLDLSYKNEYTLDYFSMDNYLTDYDLFIEVMGGFWHCDVRDYEIIRYKNQVDQIISDKRKHTHIKNNYNKEVLYLWEKDIEKNPKLILLLIKKYVESEGKLKNYHSINYEISDDKCILSKNIIKPYMEYSFKKLETVVDIKIKEKVSKKQKEKHIVYNCDYCGKEHEQLLVTYLRSKNHYCSRKCKCLSQQIGNDTDNLKHKHNCDYCNCEMEVRNYIYQEYKNGNRKNIFCSIECHNKWMSEYGIGENNPNYKGGNIKKNCLYCNNEFETINAYRDRAKYCSVECRQLDRRKRIKYKCDYCGIDCETTPYKYNSTKNHFCSHKCADAFRSEKAYEIRQCEYCKKDFRVRKALKKRFCSTTCQAKWQSKVLRGTKANNFKHGQSVM